ncbi:MAG TPA: CDP-diacylglycerol--glycerol-3-phosphate 3-phosphatidyltransferase [Smithellaceae bacterium]|nr:CDP-diacylglycerol--glycerol-3-phosphate 3-phosphatidyltransferase [Smithellaceae bacterium]HRS89980.1 CDP-diacylglycerol--glycerol-3-phosphate 3-phosphatidyltransferase [Smithellaceae bacterium]HRV25874.1 CDP-diacylglycerol--glycerol-3-phosphate 3-phosphatidyltransferase [Smithellaceae bacterium]
MLLKKEVFNLPNIITLIRIGMVPFLFTLLLWPGKFWSLVLAILFVLASLTDLIDGYIARKYSLVTTLGKFLDPMADKLIVNSAMILMIPIGRIDAWIVAIIIIRDFLVDGIRSIASTDGMYIQASEWGKKKTLAQSIAITALIIHYPFFGIDAHFVGTIILYVALFLTIISGLDYFIKYYRYKSQSKENSA